MGKIRVGFGAKPYVLDAHTGRFFFQGAPQGLRAAIASGGSGFIPNASLGVTYSGTFADGQTMTVNVPGNILGGARTNAKPLYWWWFGEDGSNSFASDTSICRTAKTLTPYSGNTFIQSSIMPPNAQGAMQYVPVQGTSNPHSAFSDTPVYTWTTNADTGLRQLYLWIKRYYAYTTTGGTTSPGNQKPWRAWKATFSLPDVYPSWNGSDFNHESEASNSFTGGGGSTGGLYNPINGWQIGTWTTDEHIFQESTFNTQDGILQWIRDAGIFYTSNTRFKNGNSVDGAGPIDQGFLDEVSSVGGRGPNGTTDTGYYSAFMADDDLRQLFVTNEGGTYQTKQWNVNSPSVFLREVQLQSSRGSTSITFRVRQGSHASLTGKHLIATTGYLTAVDLGVGA